MDRPIPLKVLLLCLILCGYGTVMFGWYINKTRTEGTRDSALAHWALEVASVPSIAADTLHEVAGYATGSYRDEAISVKRPPAMDYTAFTPPETAPGIHLDGLLIKADTSAMASGWRFLVGAFTLNGEIENAALLMSPEMTVVRSWILNEIQLGELKPRPKFKKFAHGVEMLRDGSVVFTFDGSMSLQRIDACGERQWAIPGAFHHAVTLDDKGETVWTFNLPDRIYMQVSATGLFFGPIVVLLASLATASAAKTAVASWRVSTTRMPRALASTRIGEMCPPQRVKRNRTP